MSNLHAQTPPTCETDTRDSRDTRVFDLACALMLQASVTPADGDCQTMVAQRLGNIGFNCEFFNSGGVTNLWARRGTARPLVVLAGHTDVVPTGPLDQWLSDPFKPEVRHGVLYGRGAADMKSSLAAFVVAIEDFVATHPQHTGSIAVLFTSDEEGPATDGTVLVCNALKARGEAMDYCIVGEPTSSDTLGDTIKNGRRGSMSGKLTIKGVQCHIAYPEKGRNPIHQAAPALAALTAIAFDHGNDYYLPTSFQISNIHGGTGASNIIPGDVVVDFNLRFSTQNTPETIKNTIHACLDAQSGLEYDLKWTVSGLPFLTPKGTLCDAMSAAIMAETGISPALSTTGGTSDGRFIAQICPQVIEFGPINESIHKLNEHIKVADLQPLAGIYRRALENLLLA
jgi:succinyl-diaminopimelate desuccinylase